MLKSFRNDKWLYSRSGSPMSNSSDYFAFSRQPNVPEVTYGEKSSFVEKPKQGGLMSKMKELFTRSTKRRLVVSTNKITKNILVDRRSVYYNALISYISNILLYKY